jgi:hypothetical protein
MFRAKSSRLLVLALALAVGSRAQAKPLVIPYPGFIEQEGLLQPSVLLGKPGFTLEGIGSTDLIPSRISVAGAFPLFNQDSLRASGWMWAVRAGVSEMLHNEGRAFAAGQYFLEAGLGRGTAAPLFEDRSGLRGYMEMSFRTDRPRINPRMTAIAQSLGADVRDKLAFVSLKIGAGSSLDAEGLVKQKPGTWGNRVQSQVYLPTTPHGGAVLNFLVEGYRLCGSASWLCGWHVSYQHHYETTQTADYDELSDLAGVGLLVNYYAREDYNLSSRVTWKFVGNAHQHGFDAVPLLQLLLTKKF